MIVLVTSGTSLQVNRLKSKTRKPYDYVFGPGQWAFYGLDARKLDLFTEPSKTFKIDDAIFEPIFPEWKSKELTSKKYSTLEGLSLMGLTVNKIAETKKTSAVTDISGQKDLVSKFSTELTVAEPFSGLFTLSASYSNSKSLTLEQSSKYSFTTVQQTKYIAGIDFTTLKLSSQSSDLIPEENIKVSSIPLFTKKGLPGSQPTKTTKKVLPSTKEAKSKKEVQPKIKFTKKFREAVEALPTEYSEQNKEYFKTFFDTYGTHYIKKVSLGCRAVVKGETKKNNRVDKTAKDGKLSLKVKDSVLTLGGSSEGSTTDTSEVTNEETVLIGYPGTKADELKCETEADYAPIIMNMGSLVSLISQYFNKYIVIPEEKYCQMEKTSITISECNPLDPIFAITELFSIIQPEDSYLDRPNAGCPTGYEDLSILHSAGSHKRQITNENRWCPNRYLCQKRENIVNADGTLKPFIIFNSVGISLTKTNRPACLLDGKNQCVNLMENCKRGNEAYPFYQKSTRITKDVAEPILDFALFGGSLKSDCSQNLIVPNNEPDQAGEYNAYSCNCNGANGYLGDDSSFVGLCHSKTRK